jgi:hypothetical protein
MQPVSKVCAGRGVSPMDNAKNRSIMGDLMKKLLLLAVLCAAPASGADQLYIVPVFATRVVGASGQSTTHVHIVNAGSSAANVTIQEIFAAGGLLDCPLAPNTQTLAPLEARDDIRPFCGANIVAAYTMTSDQPLVITDDIETAGASHVEHQSVRVLSDWLPANRQSLIPNVTVGNGGNDRTNLFLVNPSPFPITVSVHLARPVAGAANATLDLAFDVPSKTTIVRPLPVIPIVCLVAPCDVPEEVLVRGSGIFYAGASWLQNDDPVFRDPVVIDE